MPATITSSLSPQTEALFKQAWPVIFGLLVMYVPTYLKLVDTVWTDDAYAHGPIVLMVVLWLIWDKRTVFSKPAEQIATGMGGMLLGFGLLCYVLGRSQDILLLEVGSQIPVFAGAILLLQGKSALRSLWFPLLFVVFMVPLPGFILDSLTGPLKIQVSWIVEDILYWFGYPIARNGTIITIGAYQLLVADACSGLNSMYSLSAMGILFMYLRGRTGLVHNGLLLASLLPVAFAANIVRVIALVLITYYMGDAAGQGFLHDLSGIVEFVVALLFIFLLDGVLAMLMLLTVRKRQFS